jgi:CheY-like chemotaxis protein
MAADRAWGVYPIVNRTVSVLKNSTTGPSERLLGMEASSHGLIARLTPMQSRHRSPQTVLYVEDSEDDFLLFKLASRKCGTPFSLQHVADGEQAVAYLSREGAYADGEEYPFPDLVLLDLKMPRLDGFEVLEWIRSNSATRTLPVVVLAGSSFRADIRRALELGANSYAAKPAKFEELQVLIDQIAEVWLAREKVPG